MMKKMMIVSLMIFGLMNAPQIAAAEEDMWDKTKAGASSAWSSTTTFVSEAADWTVKQSRSAWENTSKAAEDAAQWSSEKVQKGWHSTRKMANSSNG